MYIFSKPCLTKLFLEISINFSKFAGPFSRLFFTDSGNSELELMFMKHYAPNRCLYINVAKLRTEVGSAEMSHLQNCSLKIYLKRGLGGGGGGGRVGGGGGSGWM